MHPHFPTEEGFQTPEKLDEYTCHLYTCILTGATHSDAACRAESNAHWFDDLISFNYICQQLQIFNCQLLITSLIGMFMLLLFQLVIRFFVFVLSVDII